MIDKETYKKELMRMYAWVRDDDTYNMKECCNFTGKNCNECPIRQYCFVFNPHARGMTRPYDAFEVIETVEKWSKEHPQKHKISKLEYDILKCRKGRDVDYCFYWDSLLLALLEKGYFKGANKDMKLKTYLDNCEVIKNEQD